MEANMNRRHGIEKLLKAEDVAEILNVSRSFVYALIQNGQIPGVRLNRSVRVRPEDLELFLTRNLSDEDNTLTDLQIPHNRLEGES